MEVHISCIYLLHPPNPHPSSLHSFTFFYTEHIYSRVQSPLLVFLCQKKKDVLNKLLPCSETIRRY